MRVLITAFIIVNPNPLIGPHNDWAPLTHEYAVCAETATTHFDYTVCTTGAYDRALHPTFNA